MLTVQYFKIEGNTATHEGCETSNNELNLNGLSLFFDRGEDDRDVMIPLMHMIVIFFQIVPHTT
ncbi:MAG: hypothetical protein ACI90V_012939 [Bacillariaceae sp.]|jgi:hypothetical protein